MVNGLRPVSLFPNVLLRLMRPYELTEKVLD